MIVGDTKLRRCRQGEMTRGAEERRGIEDKRKRGGDEQKHRGAEEVRERG